MKLFISAITKFLLGVVLVGLLLFLPAGTFNFAYGWLFLILLFVPMFVAGIIMFIKKPELLESRLDAKEKLGTQSVVIKLCGLMFIIGFLLAGFGIRFNWYTLPKGVVAVASVVFLVAYGLYAQVLRENAYLSRTIKVQENQTVIDTGLYSVVRHPMYFASVLLFLMVPLVLGSIYAFVIFLIYPFLIAKRIKSEEEFLEKELNGYTEYKQKVKYKLIPFIW